MIMNFSIRVNDPGRKAWVCLLLLVLVLCFPVFSSADEPSPRAFRMTAVPQGKSAAVRAVPGKKGEVLFTLEAGDTCEVIGQEDSYYIVRKDGQTGYAAASLLDTQAAEASPAVPESLCFGVSLEDPIPDRHAEYLVLQGTLTSDKPVEALFLYVWDERLYRVEKTVIKQLAKPSTSVSMDILAKALRFNKFTGGRKTVYLEGVCDGETYLFFRSPAYICRENEEPAHVTGLCRNLPGTLTDTKLSTAWKATKSKPSLRFSIPEEADAVLMTLEWKNLPEPFTVELLDADGGRLSLENKAGGFYMDAVPISPEVREIILTPQDQDDALSSVRVYSEPYPRHVIQQWQEVPEKLDILFISTHQDDELLFFGGAIPAYAAREDVNTAVLYMTTCSRIRCREGLDGLWTAGLRCHPIFLGLEDYNTYNVQEANSRWRAYDPLGMLTEIICRYRPEVIVCQDFDGEYGHAQHKLTASLVNSAIERAADPELPGSWDVRKFYVHLYKENQVHMDWNQPLDDTGVITPMFLAMEGYDKHRSQHAYFSMRRDGTHYDNTLFGLYRSTVGPDVAGNDFLENIPAQ